MKLLEVVDMEKLTKLCCLVMEKWFQWSVTWKGKENYLRRLLLRN